MQGMKLTIQIHILGQDSINTLSKPLFPAIHFTAFVNSCSQTLVNYLHFLFYYHNRTL